MKSSNIESEMSYMEIELRSENPKEKSNDNEDDNESANESDNDEDNEDNEDNDEYDNEDENEDDNEDDEDDNESENGSDNEDCDEDCDESDNDEVKSKNINMNKKLQTLYQNFNMNESYEWYENKRKTKKFKTFEKWCNPKKTVPNINVLTKLKIHYERMKVYNITYDKDIKSAKEILEKWRFEPKEYIK